jgi:hypothetical protein
MAINIGSLQIALAQMPANTGGFDFSVLTQAGAPGGTMSGMSPKVAIEQAAKNEAKQRKQIAEQPMTEKDIARYTKVVKKAKTIDDVLNDPIARKVFLKANGLGQYQDAVGLAKKALASDPTDSSSVAQKLSSIQGGWLDVVLKYNFELFGVGKLQTSDALKEVTNNYVGELRLDMLDQQMPGLGTAILFKQIATKLDSPIKVLGSGIGREVVTTALGLPKQLAVQSLNAQEKALTQRIDVKKFKDPDFVDRIAQRYLIMLNGGTGGVTA